MMMRNQTKGPSKYYVITFLSLTPPPLRHHIEYNVPHNEKFHNRNNSGSCLKSIFLKRTYLLRKLAQIQNNRKLFKNGSILTIL